MKVRHDEEYVWLDEARLTTKEAFALARLLHGHAMECNRQAFDKKKEEEKNENDGGR